MQRLRRKPDAGHGFPSPQVMSPVPAPNDARVYRVMGWDTAKVQSMRTWMRNFSAAGVATQIKPGERKSIETEIKPGERKSIETKIKPGERKSIETEIKPGERKSIKTAFKSSLLPEDIESRVSILHVIEHDTVFGAKRASLLTSWRTTYNTTTLEHLNATFVGLTFDRVSRLNPSIADSLIRTVVRRL